MSPELPSQLNNQLTPLISLLLQHKIWRYQHGLSGEQGFYQIHPQFADECYRIVGSRSFGRYGQVVWQAIRIQAEQWYQEKQNRTESIHRQGEKMYA